MVSSLFMDFLMDSTVARVLLGLGLACLCGLRAFLPLFLLVLAIRMAFMGAPAVEGTWAALLERDWVLAALGALALLELVLDKITSPMPAFDLVVTPLRVAAGALAFAVPLNSQGLVTIVIAAVAGAAVALIGHTARGALRPGAEETAGAHNRPFLSFFEDLAAAAGTIAVLAFPFLGTLLFLFVLFLVYRVRTRQSRKYKGLRILRD